jgi:predicted transcriptional regulator
VTGKCLVGAAHLDHYWLSAMFNRVSREYIARLESGKHDPPLSRIEKIVIPRGHRPDQILSLDAICLPVQSAISAARNSLGAPIANLI